MSAVAWTDNLNLDYEPMDQVHQAFIALLASAQQADDSTLVQRWRELVEHTQMHFALEDGWMRSRGCASAQNHMLQHRLVLNLMREGLGMARAGQLRSLRDMAGELAVWFVKHTQSMDAELALQMRGESSVVAHAT